MSLIFLLVPKGRYLILQRDGLEIHRGHSAVWFPWSLFSRPGNAFVEMDQITLPIAVEFLDLVERREHDTPVAYGEHAAASCFYLKGGSNAVLRNETECDSRDLGRLILNLGRLLGDRANHSAVSIGVPEEAPGAAAAIVRGGWLEIPLTRWQFPALCCECETATRDLQEFFIRQRWAWVIGLVTFFHYHPSNVKVPLPVCEKCLRSFVRKRRAGIIVGIVVGLAVALAGALLAGRGVDEIGKIVLIVLAAVLGPVLGFIIGEALVSNWFTPLSGAIYLRRTGTVCLRFRRMKYAERVLKWQSEQRH